MKKVLGKIFSLIFFRFAQLLEGAASEAPNVRFRFTSPHPKDFTDEVINVIKTYPNVCK